MFQSSKVAFEVTLLQLFFILLSLPHSSTDSSRCTFPTILTFYMKTKIPLKRMGTFFQIHIVQLIQGILRTCPDFLHFSLFHISQVNILNLMHLTDWHHSFIFLCQFYFIILCKFSYFHSKIPKLGFILHSDLLLPHFFADSDHSYVEFLHFGN